MRVPRIQTVFWIAAYLTPAIGPLASIAFMDELPPSRGFWIEFAVALGFIAFAMLALQFVLTARFKHIAAPHGLDVVLQFHREAGLVAVAFAVLHPVVLIATEQAYLDFFTVPLAAALIAMVALVVLTLRRRTLGISYEWWRLSHGVLGVLVVAVALFHILEVEWYVTAPGQRRIWMALTAAALLLLVHVRIGKPLSMLRRPYRVFEVRSEGARTWTLSLAPVHPPILKFRAGQFAWLTLGATPFSLQQHPFSISSSARRTDRIEFTIRELGDFTSTIGAVTPGTKAFVEGPYGAFSPDFSGPAGLVLISGGVGIAPMMSMIRTMNDSNDRRPVVLIYGSRTQEDIVFRDEIERLTGVMNLKAVFVLEEESGPITDELLNRSLPPRRRSFEYFVCGPAPMLDSVERYLASAGIPPRQVHSERFDIA